MTTQEQQAHMRKVREDRLAQARKQQRTIVDSVEVELKSTGAVEQVVDALNNVSEILAELVEVTKLNRCVCEECQKY